MQLPGSGNRHFVLYINAKTYPTERVQIMKKIDLSNNIAFFRGAVAPFVRMNKELQEFYSSIESWKIRSNCPSGMKIVMQSNAEKLQIAVEFGSAARQVFTTDVEVDGSITTFDGPGTHTIELAPGMKNIIIYPPHLVELAKFEVSVNADAVVEPVADTQSKLLICGDSILQGMTCSSPAKASVVLTSKALNMHLHNTSVGGALMNPIPVKATLDMGGANDIAVVGFGANDSAQQKDVALFRSQVRQTLEYLSSFPGKSIIITPIPSTEARVEEPRPLYCSIIREEHAAFPKVKLLEGESFYPANNPDLFVDGLHPNDEGMKIYADGLIKAISEL